MRAKGAVTPPTVYRSLDKLIEKGLAHRLESLNAYVTCKHPHPHEMAAFAICEACGLVKEFTDSQIGDRLAHWSDANAFYPKKVTVEVAVSARPAQSSGNVGRAALPQRHRHKKYESYPANAKSRTSRFTFCTNASRNCNDTTLYKRSFTYMNI